MGRSRGPHPQYNLREVQDLAWRHGSEQLPTHPNNRGMMVSFWSEKCRGVRMNVYLTTGTVGTALTHARQGSTQMFRKGVDTKAKLGNLLANPRAHTGTGYQRREQWHRRESYEDEEVEEDSEREDCYSEGEYSFRDANIGHN
eukprot:GFUD01111762.1.p1 GENE.GFUD01111762.1~~GFUD01111762.1.p1  ORF type:complete len:143 (+),score=39.21 GFUD01111762.1:75-503(+)